MAKQGKPEGNKRQRERDKRRKKEEKAARRLANTGGQSSPGAFDAHGDPVDGEPVDDQLGEGEASPSDSQVEHDANADKPSLPAENSDDDARRVP